MDIQMLWTIIQDTMGKMMLLGAFILIISVIIGPFVKACFTGTSGECIIAINLGIAVGLIYFTSSEVYRKVPARHSQVDMPHSFATLAVFMLTLLSAFWALWCAHVQLGAEQKRVAAVRVRNGNAEEKNED